MQQYEKVLRSGLVPDLFIRMRIRALLRQRLRDEREPTAEKQQERLMGLIAEMRAAPIAIATDTANAQHYEVPTDFYRHVMGSFMKYSSCYWEAGVQDLSEAEKRALEITCAHAALEDDMDILELGCGWGSLTMFMAAKYPKAKITAVSNSKTQKIWIDAQCAERGLHNVTILTEDMNALQLDAEFDRVVSVEIFEHMRNYEKLLQKVSGFLKTDGRLFVHIFTHKDLAYFFDVVDDSDWMSKYFFTGGIMPSDDLLFYFNTDLTVEKHWQWDGTHYAKTAEAWLRNMDRNKNAITPILESTYGKENVSLWRAYWRIFFMACAELWNFNNGREWMVSHYLLRKK
ncbi:MAG: cyclopropane-fatty-acyl-phospholipid synthase family protein [Chitinophagales bacterium]